MPARDGSEVTGDRAGVGGGQPSPPPVDSRTGDSRFHTSPGGLFVGSDTGSVDPDENDANPEVDAKANESGSGMLWSELVASEDDDVDLSGTVETVATGIPTPPEVEATVVGKATHELINVMARERAKAWRDRDRFKPPTDLPTDGADWLDTEDEPLRYAVQGALNVLYGEPERPAIWTVSAMFKFGKTTFFADFVRCAADGEVFGGDLGFRVNLDEGRRIVHTNYEVADRTLRVKWYRPLAISNRDRFSVMSLRPAQVRLASEAAADWMTEQLKRRAAQIWIVDTFSRCGALDGSENSNEDVNAAYDRLLEIGARAGVELVVVADHMGKSTDGKTARGATSKQDYPDDFSTGQFTNDEDFSSPRILNTRGRSDDEARSITYTCDMATRRHTITEAGAYKSPATAKADAKAKRIDVDILATIDAAEEPMTKTAISTSGIGQKQDVMKRVDALIESGVLESAGKGRPVTRRIAKPSSGEASPAAEPTRLAPETPASLARTLGAES